VREILSRGDPDKVSIEEAVIGKEWWREEGGISPR